jgi:hypothetical protein
VIDLASGFWLAASMKETYERFGLMEKLLWQHSSLAGPVAAMLAARPDSLVLTIRMHHESDRLPQLDDPVARLTALTTVTSMCLSKLGVGRSRPIEELELSTQLAWRFLGLPAEDVEPILTHCADRVKESQVLMD